MANNGNQTPIAWEPIDVNPIIKDGRTAIPDAAIENINKNKIALKGPLAVRKTKSSFPDHPQLDWNEGI